MKKIVIAALVAAGVLSLVNCAPVEISNGNVGFTVGVDENSVTLGITGKVDVSPVQVDETEELVGASSPADADPAARTKTLKYDGDLDPEREKVLRMIEQSALAHGLDPTALAAVGWIESRFRNVRNPRSSAAGIMQFIRSTAKLYELADPYDVAANIDAGARLMRDNRRALRKALSVKPDAWMLYLSHQQGVGGAVKLLKAGIQLAADVVGGDEFNLNTTLDSNASAADFANEWRTKFEKAQALFSYD